MSYTKTQWNNDTAPAINETNLNKIEQGIYDNDSHIGDLTTLTTTAKTSTVNAVNEVNGNIGTLSNLTTTANTDLVSAINEVDGNTDINTAKLNGTQVAGDMVVDSIRTKNLLDTAKFVAGSSSVSILDAKNGTLEIQSTNGYYSQANQAISLKANTTYTISYNGVAEQTGSAVVCAIRNLADTATIARQEGSGDKTLTFTTTENGAIIRFMVTAETNTGKTKYTNIQLEEGSTATPYTPHQELNNQEVYSTGETKIGTWIDGKPLYRKVIVATNLATNTENSIVVSDASIISVKKIEGYYIGGGGGNIASSGTLLGTDSDNTRSYVFYSPANGSLKSYCGVYNTGNGKYDTHIILEYTKTTD